jgi:hypothetical protein
MLYIDQVRHLIDIRAIPLHCVIVAQLPCRSQLVV